MALNTSFFLFLYRSYIDLFFSPMVIELRLEVLRQSVHTVITDVTVIQQL